MKLLTDLYLIYSPSHGEKKISKFIQKELTRMKITDFTVDKKHQISRFVPNTPLLVAHMDQQSHKPLTKVLLSGTKIWGDGNLGADDKNGIWIILNILKKHPNMSFIFSSCEEAGCAVDEVLEINKEELKRVKYGLVFDRMNGKDIIGELNYYCTEDFETDIVSLGEDFGYRSIMGLFSDCDMMSEYMSCVNLSCGYYKSHSTKEYTSIIELKNALEFGLTIVEKITKNYDKPVINAMAYGWRSYTRYGSGYYKYGFEDRYEDSYRDWEYYDDHLGNFYYCSRCNTYENYGYYLKEEGVRTRHCYTCDTELVSDVERYKQEQEEDKIECYYCSVCDFTWNEDDIEDGKICPICRSSLLLDLIETDVIEEGEIYCDNCGAVETLDELKETVEDGRIVSRCNVCYTPLFIEDDFGEIAGGKYV